MLLLSKEVLGWISVGFCALGYVPYTWMVLKRRLKPHGFSWFIWGSVCVIVFAAQSVKSAGPGAWATAASGFFCLLFAAMSLRYGEKDITRSDWITFITALCSIPLWYVTKNPLWSVVLLSLIDMLACYPTIRKSWGNPHQESAYSFTVQNIKFVFALFAIEHFTMTTALFPVCAILGNSSIIATILLRRYALRTHKQITDIAPL